MRLVFTSACRAGAVVVIAIAASSLCAAPALPEPAQDPYHVSARVEMVSLDVTVLDKNGSFVSGLSQDNFEVYEDGVRQEIKFFQHEDVPVTIGLVVDGSGSMRPKRSYVIAAAMAFAQASNRDDELFTLDFNDRVNYGLTPGQDFTSDLGQLRTALMGVECDGRTALYDALAEALRHVKTGRFDRKALLVVSDGEDNCSTTDFDDVLQLARESGATIYTISAYDPSSARHNTRILKRLSKVSGGQFYLPTSTPQIVSVCRQIAKDIRNRYTIAYTSANVARDGAYRHILVKAVSRNGQKLTVRVREGYCAASSETTAAKPTDGR